MSNDYYNPDNYFAQQAKQAEETARLAEVAAKSDLDSEKFSNQSNLDLIVQLRNKTSSLSEQLNQLQQENAQLKNDNAALESLFSLSMEDMAAKNPRFRQSHDAQQLALAKWILSQKAYAETAFRIGIAAGKSAEEITALYKDSISSVLANATRHGNNAVGHPVLKANAERIIKNNQG